MCIITSITIITIIIILCDRERDYIIFIVLLHNKFKLMFFYY